MPIACCSAPLAKLVGAPRTIPEETHTERIKRHMENMAMQLETMTRCFSELQVELLENEDLDECREEEMESSPVREDEDMEVDLLEAIRSGNSDRVRFALDDPKVDVNEEYKDIKVVGKQFATSTPLVVAALLGQRGVVRTLTAAGASLEGTYSFVAGAEQKIWSGTVAHVPIPSGNLDLLKDLAELKADMNTVGSNQASLLWQACYFGKANILEYLLEDVGLSYEQRAQSQDDFAVYYSPLHVAITQGHTEIVNALLAKKAQIAVDNGKGRTPLNDAVKDGQADIVHALILKQGDIFQKVSVQQEGVFSHEASAFDHMITYGDPVLLAKVMQALASAPNLLDRMSKQDFLQVLSCEGDAPVHILESIFQKQRLWHWEAEGEKLFRKQRNHAYLNKTARMNFVEGPHARFMKQLFDSKKTLTDSLKAEFIDKLFRLDQTSDDREGVMYVPVVAYMCHIPRIHKDLNVLMALVDCPNKEIFRCDGVAAIVSWSWKAERPLARFTMVLALVELVNFMIINLLMDETLQEDIKYSEGSLALVNGCVSAAIWLVVLFIEALQFLGYWANRSTSRYLCSPRHWFQLVVLVLTGCFIGLFLNPNAKETWDTEFFSTTLGILLFLKWFKMLVYLRQFQAIAVRILPITSTMWDVGPFLLVMCVYLFASVNLYYAFRNDYGLEECFIIIYRLTILGDFNLGELEHKTKQRSEYFHVARTMLVVLSFLIGVTMMNLFIAILCVAYDEAAKQVDLAFMESRSCIVLDQHAIRRGLKQLQRCLGFRRHRQQQDGEDDADIIATATINSNCVAVAKVSGTSFPDDSQIRASQWVAAENVLDADPSGSAFLWYITQRNKD